MLKRDCIVTSYNMDTNAGRDDLGLFVVSTGLEAGMINPFMK